MSQKWPSRGPERTFLPLRGLSKEWAFHIAKGAAREKTSLDFLEFSPYGTQSLGLRADAVFVPRPHAFTFADGGAAV
eukprot:scaffold100694_cov36-Phaeocystis_antarctica.AAC.1